MARAKLELDKVTLMRNHSLSGPPDAASMGVILKDITTAFPEGEITAVLGPSGAGKSSLLRLLNRLEDPSAGRILLDGQDIRDMDVFALRRRVGMVWQLPTLFPGTVLDNVTYGPRLRGVSAREAGEQ